MKVGSVRVFRFFLILYLLAMGVPYAFAKTPGYPDHNEAYKEAEKILGRAASALIQLPEAQHQVLQSYYDGIFEKVRLAGEENVTHPEVFLVHCKGASAFVNSAKSKSHIFYCFDFFRDKAISRDIDAYVYSHELTHFDQTHMSDLILREYDADLRGTLKRLVRLGERDPQTFKFYFNSFHRSYGFIPFGGGP